MRATEGLIRSLIEWGNLGIQAPDYSTLCLRQKDLAVCLSKTKKKKPLHAVVDATGLKVFGEGEWKVRQHGYIGFQKKILVFTSTRSPTRADQSQII